jgi:hypothetical protein
VSTHSRLLISGVLLCLACRGTPEVRRSGFLDDYSRLAPLADDKGALDKGVWVYRSSRFDPQRYDGVMLDEPVAFLHPDADANEIDSAERIRLTREFGSVVRNTLRDNGYKVTEIPGPRILRVRAGLTDLFVRIAPLSTEGRRGRITLEGASMEAELTDSESGDVMMSVMSSRRGGGVQSYAGSDHQRVFQFWADNLVKLLKTGS